MPWRDELPEELRDNKSLEDVPDVSTLAKRFIDTKSMVGNSIRIPGEDASEEDWNEFNGKILERVPKVMLKPDTTDEKIMETVYDQLGRPEKPEKYEVPEIDTQGLEIDIDVTEGFKPVAHKYGLSQKQYDGIVKELAKSTVDKTLRLKAERDEDAKALVNEWGRAYDRNMKLAVAGAEKTGAPTQLINLLKSEFPPSDLAKYFHNIATTLGDGEGNQLVTDEGTGTVMTPQEAKLQMSEMRRNKAHPLNNPGDPDHKAALDKYAKLAKAAYI